MVDESLKGGGAHDGWGVGGFICGDMVRESIR